MSDLYSCLGAEDYYCKRKDARINGRSKPRLAPRKTCDCKVPRTRPQVVCRCSQPEEEKEEQEQEKEKEEEIPPLTHESAIRSSKRFANAALSYLHQKGHEYELVSVDYYEGGTVGGGVRFHHNFQAKRAHDPDAPVETFFTQVFMRRLKYGYYDGLNVIVECCVSLGNSDTLPKKRDNIGCELCSKYVHHPRVGCEGMNGLEWMNGLQWLKGLYDDDDSEGN